MINLSAHIHKLLAHEKCIITTQIRNKKYYRHWWIPFHLDDFQTITQSKPNAYEQWNREWTESRLPTELHYFDTSRLPSHLKARIKPSKEFFKLTNRKEKTEDYQRRLFGQYGLQSGIDPALLFMNENEITYEKTKENLLENSILEIVTAQKEQEKKARMDNETLMLQIKKNLNKMPEIIKKFHDQEAKQTSMNTVKKNKMEMLMEEARDRFGFYPDKKDPKFLKLIQEFDEQDKLERKQKKDKRV
ncbi:putative growth arrest and DNA-damage-inducible proteins-interacting protein [Schistosoma mansoni]|uniref:Large ribosomal subunit protein mL64 n=1 Tax=Schistosoma mansoni TaxID=6183 RepID=G4VLB2_SCHMA|nr:putative growth arrest and DNA-damage-inducible proteins-interacting protein [Schistosoma mansoni]|eukprot:XP_018652866.1 putative growth arrest and DNA-damage-inducible proteins-interacting protein [Schistosoma mansoni]